MLGSQTSGIPASAGYSSLQDGKALGSLTWPVRETWRVERACWWKDWADGHGIEWTVIAVLAPELAGSHGPEHSLSA